MLGIWCFWIICLRTRWLGVLDPIYERGAYVWFLPAYSPDLNPTIACVVEGEGCFEEA